jgi:uncharacterized protein UPF0489
MNERDAMPVDFTALEPDDDFLTSLPGGVWLMDNHKWALSVWGNHHEGSPAALIHADYHWDGVDDFHGDVEEASKLVEAGLPGLDERIRQEDRVQYDSFISPAIRLGMFQEVHFFCLQDDGSDKGLSQELCEQYGVTQTLHSTVESLTSIDLGNLPLVFDLCLDLFNGKTEKMWQSDLWSDQKVQAFLNATKPLIQAANVVTVSLSFGYSGAEDGTRHLARLVVPQLVSWRA